MLVNETVVGKSSDLPTYQKRWLAHNRPPIRQRARILGGTAWSRAAARSTCARTTHEVSVWPKFVIPARYYLYSFQDIPAGPSIFQSIFQHILEYMDTDSPLEGLRSSKICQNRAKSRIIAHNRSENASLQQGGPKLFDFDSI